jgi:disulfide bond formation protein DsbB
VARYRRIEDLRKQLLGVRFVPCDEIRWSLFGISMAGYNVLASLGLAAASLWAALNITGAKRS